MKNKPTEKLLQIHHAIKMALDFGITPQIRKLLCDAHVALRDGVTLNEQPTDDPPDVTSSGLFDYKDGYARMAGYVAAHLDARVKAQCECHVLRSLLSEVRFVAYQSDRVREAINNLSNITRHPQWQQTEDT